MGGGWGYRHPCLQLQTAKARLTKNEIFSYEIINLISTFHYEIKTHYFYRNISYFHTQNKNKFSINFSNLLPQKMCTRPQHRRGKDTTPSFSLTQQNCTIPKY